MSRRAVEQALQAIEARYGALVERASDAICSSDLLGNITSVNPSAGRITGYSHAELLTMSFFDLIAPVDRPRVQEILDRRLGGAGDDDIEVELVAKDGRQLFVEVSARIVDSMGEPPWLEVIVRDTTPQHGWEEMLRHQVFHDDLTGLPNRTLLGDRLEHALLRARREGTQAAVLLLDVDDFKLINDTLGHAAGDETLVVLADRLRSILRGSETAARIGGDEFAFVAEISQSEHEVMAMAERIQSAFAEPFVIAGIERNVTGSLGIALATNGGDPCDLLRDADTAMYRAKKARKGGVEFFDETVRAELLRHLTLGQALDNGLRDGELEVYYQPIVSLSTGELLAVEALVRWFHPQWGWVQPGEFVPLAEENGMIIPLGRYVLTEVAHQAARWRDELPTALPLGVFVNLSPHELAQNDLVEFVSLTLAENGLTGADIAFELTERVFIRNHDGTPLENLDELGRLGIHLVLDDFGTGYSALAWLKSIPFAALKIDGTFVTSIRNRDDDDPITRAVVGLGSALAMAVIGEGIESEAQRDYLEDLGCDAGQGFHLGRPQPAAEVSALLRAIPSLPRKNGHHSGRPAPDSRVWLPIRPLAEDDVIEGFPDGVRVLGTA